MGTIPLVRYVTVEAKWRHIQEILLLILSKNLSGPAGKRVLASENT